MPVNITNSTMHAGSGCFSNIQSLCDGLVPASPSKPSTTSSLLSPTLTQNKPTTPQDTLQDTSIPTAVPGNSATKDESTSDEPPSHISSTQAFFTTAEHAIKNISLTTGAASTATPSPSGPTPPTSPPNATLVASGKSNPQGVMTQSVPVLSPSSSNSVSAHKQGVGPGVIVGAVIGSVLGLLILLFLLLFVTRRRFRRSDPPSGDIIGGIRVHTSQIVFGAHNRWSKATGISDARTCVPSLREGIDPKLSGDKPEMFKEGYGYGYCL